MSEVMPAPEPPAKSLEEQAREFLLLLEEIISAAPEMRHELEKSPGVIAGIPVIAPGIRCSGRKKFVAAT